MAAIGLPALRVLRRRMVRGSRTWVGYAVLAALVWPSLGSLPWAVEVAGHADALEHAFDGHDLGEAPEDHHHHDASDIPGSPTHPIDHDCPQCQAFKHLSRCALVQPAVPEVPLPAGSPVQPCVPHESAQIVRRAALPPARGPPSLTGVRVS
ncbi:MAG TPA: hypothetical protein VMN79_02045 [Casimicrobiaceae bacterium]|nr:hypothetical protein [Casimicrobiaceae bacterium]